MHPAAENKGSPMTRIVVYLRVSTEEQGESGLGLEAQEAACRAAASRLGMEIACIHRDELTGSTPLHKRPGLMDAIAALTRGVSCWSPSGIDSRAGT
jgi:DNA invertase Pin-like site-specific DNA recombinase